jgi:DNA polymerase V
VNSIASKGAWAFAAGPVLALPMGRGTVRAGFPSPAEELGARRQDLNELLIKHPLATFFWRVRGTSMVQAGIADGDILVVDRALEPRHGDIVVAEVDNDFTVKFLHRRAGRARLVASDPTFPDIVPRDGQTLVVCGVVTCAIKQFR